MTSIKKKKVTLFSVYFTFFIDNLSWAIVFPIFAPYFLDPQNLLFAPDFPVESRTTLLGIFLMAFSFGQFLGAPLIGEFADKHGRKRALSLAVFFTLIGMMISAWSMQINNLYLLLIGRLITGLFASSTSVCLSCLSDLSKNEHMKLKYFGRISMVAGLSFIIGAYAGGKLSDQTISHMFSVNFPLWLAAGLTFVNFIFVVFGFEETAPVHPSVKFHLLESFQNVGMALKTKKIKKIYFIYFLFLFGWTIFFQFIPVLTVQKFSFTNSNIGDMALFMGVCWAISSGYINKVLLRAFKPQLILEFCLIAFAILCGLVVLPKQIWVVYTILGFCVAIGGLAWPICTGMISNAAPPQMQGKVLGISQSVQSMAMALAPLIGGLAYHVSFGFPFLIVTFSSLCSVLIYFFTLKDL